MKNIAIETPLNQGRLVQFDADADPDLDPNFYLDADRDPDPSFQIKAQTLENVLK